MGGDKRVHIDWAADIDRAFRERLERALKDLHVPFADVSDIDHDPDAATPVRMTVVSFGSGHAPRDADIVVLGGPGDFPRVERALRLDADDIEAGSGRWTAFVDQVGDKLGRPSLVAPIEDLPERIDQAERRAVEAEKARAEFELRSNSAAVDLRNAEAAAAIRVDLGAIFVSMELSRSKWLITSLSPGGGENLRFCAMVRYMEIIPDRRIVFAEQVTEADAKRAASLITVEIEPEGKDTRLTITMQVSAFDADMHAGYRVGWTAALDNLTTEF